MQEQSSKRAWSLLGAAMLRPVNVAMPGIGLLVALGTEHWWAFPASLLPYAVAVVATVKNRSFVQHTLEGDQSGATGEQVEWEEILTALSLRPELVGPMNLIRASEARLLAELFDAHGESRVLLADAVARTREGARTAAQLAFAANQLDARVRFDVGPRAETMLRDAAERRAQAKATKDEATRTLLLASASSLEDSSKLVETLKTLQGRSVAQLDSLATELEGLSMRTTRYRLANAERADANSAVGDFRIDLSAAREMLQAYEETSSLDLADGVGERKQRA